MTANWKTKGPRSGPWPSRSAVRPQWVSPAGTAPPAVGGSYAKARRAFGDRREQAYQQMVDRVSNAWRTHKP